MYTRTLASARTFAVTSLQASQSEPSRSFALLRPRPPQPMRVVAVEGKLSCVGRRRYSCDLAGNQLDLGAGAWRKLNCAAFESRD